MSFRHFKPSRESQLQFPSSHPTQLKKDKERLQAMMAHLKSSEPKPAAQPVSTCYDSFN